MVESVVDYDAWRKGYMPPTEHSLVHELSHGTAQVIMSSTGGKSGYWLVSKNGKLPPRKDRLLLWKMLEVLSEDEAEIHPLAADVEINTHKSEGDQ